jgi:hypothetical protein
MTIVRACSGALDVNETGSPRGWPDYIRSGRDQGWDLRRDLYGVVARRK